MSNFEWQTEDDYDWDVPHDTASATQRRWLLPLLLILLFGVAGQIIFDRLGDTVLSATERVEKEVRSTHRTVFYAAAQTDLELFDRLLSGRDRAWAAGQHKLIGEQGLLDRSVFGLTTLSNTPEIDAISLSPDLHSVLITATVPYSVINVEDGVAQTVHLSLVNVMRRSSEQWLYAPPLTEYWGETSHLPALSESRRPILSAEFPQRDAQIVDRLLNDLTEIYKQLCHLNKPFSYRSSAENCLLNHYAIIFSRDPASLLLEKPSNITAQTQFTLPTPTLVGLPQYEAGYHVLLVGYARYIFPAIIAEITAYECCGKQQYFDALVARQLHAVGIAPAPLSTDDYANLAPRLVDFDSAEWVWDKADDDAAYLLLDYLLTTNANLTPNDIVATLNQFRTYPLWMRRTLEQADASVPPDMMSLLATQSKAVRCIAFERAKSLTISVDHCLMP